MNQLSTLAIALAGAASLHFAPALACPSLAEIDGAAAPYEAAIAWPLPGFDRMLSDSRSGRPAAAPRSQPDVLYPFFQAQLWSDPLDGRFAATPKPDRKEI